MAASQKRKEINEKKKPGKQKKHKRDTEIKTISHSSKLTFLTSFFKTAVLWNFDKIL